MLSTLSFFCCLGHCYRCARCPKNHSGFQRKCKAKCDHLRCPSYRTTIPTFISDAFSRDAKEHLVRRMIDSSNLCRISRCQMSVCFFVQHVLVSTTKLGSLRGGLAQKKSLDNSSFAKRPEHRQKHLLFDNIENNDKTWKSKGGRTNATWIQKVAVTDQWLSPCHTEPYRRILWCRSQAIHALQHLGPHAVSHGRIGVRTQHRLLPPAYCFKPPASPQVSRDG